MSVFAAITGSENFRIGSSKFHVFFVPTRRFPGKELHVGVVGKDPSNPLRILNTTILPAGRGARPELGTWTQASYDVPENMVMKLFGSRKDANVSRPTQASMFVQARDTAAFRRIHFRTTGWEHGTFSSVFLEGRFDILPVDDAVALGAVVPPLFRPYCEEEFIMRVFSVQTVSGELRTKAEVAPKVIENSQGEVVEIAKSKRRRGLDL